MLRVIVNSFSSSLISIRKSQFIDQGRLLRYWSMYPKNRLVGLPENRSMIVMGTERNSAVFAVDRRCKIRQRQVISQLFMSVTESHSLRWWVPRPPRAPAPGPRLTLYWTIRLKINYLSACNADFKYLQVLFACLMLDVLSSASRLQLPLVPSPGCIFFSSLRVPFVLASWFLCMISDSILVSTSD